MSVSTSPAAPRYAFDNDDTEAVDRHRILAQMLDEDTRARLTGLGDLTGMRCLEIGAGGGSVARWLAGRTGPTGRVVATDINTRHLPTDAGFEVLLHDLTTDPVPEGPWDLIHGRLVLLHIPEREEILGRLAGALAPGGALVLEEWATTFRRMVLAAPDAESTALLETYHDVLIDKLLAARGNDATWADRAHAAMLSVGLTDVDTRISARSWPGGSPGALLILANIGQLRDEFLAAGLTAEQLDRVGQLVRDPRVVLRGHFTYSVVGRRPPS